MGLPWKPSSLLTNKAHPELLGLPGGCLPLTSLGGVALSSLCPNLLISVDGSSESPKLDELGPDHPCA